MNSFCIHILSDKESWINVYLPAFIEKIRVIGHRVSLNHQVEEMTQGDFAFYLGCGQVIPPEILKKNKHNLVIHESDLPKGRGWSPLTWQILEGKNQIPIVLFEAMAKVDSGPVYMKRELKFKDGELIGEIRKQQAEVTFDMCLAFLEKYPSILKEAQVQDGKESFYRRRSSEDSRLDLDKTIQAQFNLLRVVDNKRYPAFFELNGERYVVTIEKVEKK